MNYKVIAELLQTLQLIVQMMACKAVANKHNQQGVKSLCSLELLNNWSKYALIATHGHPKS